MWLCCCCDGDEHTSTERSRLLISDQQVQQSTNTTGPTRVPGSNGSSSGSSRPSVMSWAESGDFTSECIWSKVVTYGERSPPPTLTMKPVKVFSADKRLQDHANLYNTLVDQWKQLDALMVELCRMFPEQNQQRTLNGTFMHLCRLIAKCQSVSVVQPHKDSICLQITYDGRDVPYQAIPAFIAYNASGKIVRQLVGKCPAVSSSVRLVLDDERKLMRDVMVASLGAEGPTCIANCRDNLESLRQVALESIDDIERRTTSIATQLRTAVELLQKRVILNDESVS